MGETYYNRSLEKGRAGYDITHRSVTYLTYELPFGRGRKWMNGGGFKDYMLGGWNASMIQTFQSGLPVTFTLNALEELRPPAVRIRICRATAC